MSVFNSVNNHCLGKILELTETNDVVASDDIYDTQGVKLWAKGGKISASLQERLASRKLRTPLELTLEVENGITTGDVADDCQKVILSNPVMCHLANNKAALAALSHLRMVRLPSALKLLLAAAYENRRTHEYLHELHTIALCAGFAAYARLSAMDTELLLSAALLHDLGVLYVNPELLEPSRRLTAREWASVAVHPRVSHMVALEIGKLRDEVGMGIGQHHERLDGSGYPFMLTKEKISPIGSILAAADAMAAIIERGGEGAAYQATLAIKLIPEEFNPVLKAYICTSLRDLVSAASCGDQPCYEQTRDVVEKLDQVEQKVAELLQGAAGKVHELLAMAGNICHNVRKALRATGVDFLLQSYAPGGEGAFCGEVYHIVHEAGWRLRNISRTLQLRADALALDEQAMLAPLIAILESPPAA
ncbi:MAG: HD domain-containing protein [Rhodocyclales bacterium GT-UBC]|nr:MAG: HD domain-containing protein [Rhodocyclales bacterium GT-UBC]